MDILFGKKIVKNTSQTDLTLEDYIVISVPLVYLLLLILVLLCYLKPCRSSKVIDFKLPNQITRKTTKDIHLHTFV